LQFKIGPDGADLTEVEREQRLLAIVRTQTELAAAAAPAAEVVLGRALQITGAQAGVVELIAGSDLRLACAGGPAMEHLGDRFPTAGLLSEQTIAQGRPLRCDDAAADDRVDVDACRRLGAISILTAPVIVRDLAVGVLKVYADQPGFFNADDEETLQLLAEALAPHIEPAPEDTSADVIVLEDSLTRTANRLAYDERIAHEYARRRRDGGPLSVVLLDLDGLAQINDDHGHQEGDGVLRTLAAVLRRWTRSVDGLYRIGGDEFALILPGATYESALGLTERIAKQLRDSHPLEVTASFGIAAETGGDVRDLHAIAEADLASAKRRRAA
jgi:diguanylate cyclase (GGDEF)-like protein